MAKKYLSLERLTEYDTLIKNTIDSGDQATLKSAKEYTNGLIDSHNHDDKYYTESEIDTKVSNLNTSISNITNGTTTVKKAEEANHATSADSASNADKLGGQSPSYYAKASDIPTGALASKDIISESDLDTSLAEKVNAASEGNHSHLNKEELDKIATGDKAKWDAMEDNAKAYADELDAAVKEAYKAADAELQGSINGLSSAIETAKQEAIDIAATDAANKDVAVLANVQTYVDGLNTAMDERMDAVEGKAHEHSNKSVIDGITSAKVSAWDSAEDNAKLYTDTEVAKKADKDHNHDSKYDTKGAASDALTESKGYTDEKIALLMNNSSEAVDSIMELAAAMEDNADVVDALEQAIGTKADASALTSHTGNTSNPHGVTKAQVGLGDVENKSSEAIRSEITKANVTTALGYTPYTPGEVDNLLGAKADQTSLDTHASTVGLHVSDTDRTNWNAAKTHADSAHAPSNAQANVIESIKVNGTAQTITSKSVNITVPTDNKDLANGAGYLVASDIANKANKATTLSGYGITDAYTKSEVDAKTVVDSALSETSTNPVQNKVVNSAIKTAAEGILANANSITTHNTRIGVLEDLVGEGFEEVTSQEIQNLFKNN